MLSVAIGLNANNRPRYLLDVLASWDRAERFAGRHAVELRSKVVRQEPGPEAQRCAEWAKTYGWELVTNDEQLGVLVNPWTSMELDVLPHSPDLMVLAEDDSLVAADSLMLLRGMVELVDWSTDWDRDRTLFCLNHRWARPLVDAPDPDNVITEGAEFCPSVWACTPALWRNVLGPTWDKDYTYRGWDWHLTEGIIPEHGIRVMAPAVSRSNHIGIEGGAHMTPELAPGAHAATFNPHLAQREFRFMERSPE